MTTTGEGRTNGYRSLSVAAAMVAMSALAGTVGLVTGSLSLGTKVDHRLPFHSPVVGGIALALLVGLPFGALALRAWGSDRRAGFDSMVVGAALIGWLVVELAFIRTLSFFQPLFGAIGLAFILAGWVLTRSPGAIDEMTVDRAAVDRFLAQRRIALVGASSDPRKFSHTVLRALVDHGHEVLPVNPRATQVDGIACHRSVGEVAAEVDGVMIMLTGDAAMSCVRECIAAGVTRVWLFRGAGSPGALSSGAVEALRAAKVDVVAGACPLMFLEPVARFHQVHLAVRRLDGSVAAAA